MIGSNGNGSRRSGRSGARVLTLFAPRLKIGIFSALKDGPAPRSDLARTVGSPAHTTLRSHITELEAIGGLVERKRDVFPGTIDYELTMAGRGLLSVTAAVAAWLQRSPGDPITIGSSAARLAIHALVEGWTTTILRTLSDKPMCLTELDEQIGGINHPSIERRLTAMRRTGLIEPHSSRVRGRPYVPTAWGRAGFDPVVAALSWEREHFGAPAGRGPEPGQDLG